LPDCPARRARPGRGAILLCPAIDTLGQLPYILGQTNHTSLTKAPESPLIGLLAAQTVATTYSCAATIPQ
jgi:hypothetical protein